MGFFFSCIFNVYLVTYGPKRRRIGYRTGTTSQATCIASSLPVVKYGANWLPDLGLYVSDTLTTVLLKCHELQKIKTMRLPISLQNAIPP